jgi:hypothetical protein
LPLLLGSLAKIMTVRSLEVCSPFKTGLKPITLGFKVSALPLCYHICNLNPSFILAVALDKLKRTGQNLGRVFNSRFRHACEWHAFVQITTQPNLKLKTRPKQLFRFSPVSFCAPLSSFGLRVWLNSRNVFRICFSF